MQEMPPAGSEDLPGQGQSQPLAALDSLVIRRPIPPVLDVQERLADKARRTEHAAEEQLDKGLYRAHWEHLAQTCNPITQKRLDTAISRLFHGCLFEGSISSEGSRPLKKLPLLYLNPIRFN